MQQLGGSSGGLGGPRGGLGWHQGLCVGAGAWLPPAWPVGKGETFSQREDGCENGKNRAGKSSVTSLWASGFGQKKKAAAFSSGLNVPCAPRGHLKSVLGIGFWWLYAHTLSFILHRAALRGNGMISRGRAQQEEQDLAVKLPQSRAPAAGWVLAEALEK